MVIELSQDQTNFLCLCKKEFSDEKMRNRNWSPEEDDILREQVKEHGERNWNLIEQNSGLHRSAQSCRQRWINYLKFDFKFPFKFDLKKSPISTEEEELLIHLHEVMGNQWAKMAKHFPGRSETELNDFWNTRRSQDLDQKRQQIVARSRRRCGADLLEIPAFITLCFLASGAQACYARMFAGTFGSGMPDLRFLPEASIEAVSVSSLRPESDRKSFLRFGSGIEARLRSPVPLDLNLPPMESPYRRFVVGYALSPKKAQSLIRPSLLRAALNRGVDLVPVDPRRPLAEQGPFDCVIHKLQDDEWKAQLADFAAKNPGVPIVDQPLAIKRLHDRNTMLQLVSKLNVPHGTETFGVPKQAVLQDFSAVYKIGNLPFPIIAKPLVSDGIAKSHGMSLVWQLGDLLMIQPPLLLLEFVNHGGVIFKVNVAGNYVRCARRKSLPDVPPEQHHSVASYTLSMFPPSSFLEKIAMGLRRVTGLRLFSFDMIRAADAPHHYFIIDINYFPDYSKIPGYEEFMAEFFWDMVHQREESDASSSLSTNDC